jgi:hypothetical protein
MRRRRTARSSAARRRSTDRAAALWIALAAALIAAPARSDAIAYRMLRRSDFRAKAPPAEGGVHAERMGAYTCGRVIPEEPIAIRIEPAERGFTARAPTFRVHGVMDRDCSWWNAKLEHAQPPAYILQHEQIHFALIALAARDLESRGRALVERGATIEAAHAAFQRALDALHRDVAQKLQARSDAFDRDTSGVYEPDVQRRWLDRVTAELAR